MNWQLSWCNNLSTSEVLDFDHNVKKAQLKIQGWEDDIVGAYNSESNGGWKARRNLFLKYRKPDVSAEEELEFREDAVPFIASLSTDLQGLSQGLIPFTPWKVEIIFKKADFVIWTPVGTNTKYKLHVAGARLHVMMGGLNDQICNSIKSHLEKGAAKYHFRGKGKKRMIFPALV
jgi:hypothetical protein